ncbi:unnamed protein product [Hymenolepis diminuta]|uniref:DUF4201 domain-containing protein n=1 Tax=Hymenolepis diminuta TaxID=6216 RepID=A0A0R3S8W9_HYMDI|nr:unnamed protein product [Hymenolepis diminuta]
MEESPRDPIEGDPDNKNFIQKSTENKSETVDAKDNFQLILSNDEIVLNVKISQHKNTILEDRESLKEDEKTTSNTASAEGLNVAQAVNDDKSKILKDNEEQEEISEKSESTDSFNEKIDQSLNSSESVSTNDTVRERRRQDLINQQNELLERQRKAAQFNIQLQTILSNHFRRKRADAGEIAHSHLDNMTSSALSIGIDHAAEYARQLKTLSQVRKQYFEQKERLDAEISSIKNLTERKVAEATEAHDELTDFILKQGSQAISSKTGRVVPVDIYKDLIDSWQKKNAAITVERLENIRLQHQVEKIKNVFKAYDLSESLHLIDFEQMKIENQTYNEKIEERNEETGKLKRKINNTVQILTHSSEKLSSCETGFSQLKKQLGELTDKLNSGRDSLAKLKQKRDALRANYTAMQKTCGLLGQTEMLRGFEESVDNVKAKKQELLNIKEQTRELREKAKHYEQQVPSMKGQKMFISN